MNKSSYIYKRKFIIPVGDISKEEVEEYIKELQKSFKDFDYLRRIIKKDRIDKLKILFGEELKYE